MISKRLNGILHLIRHFYDLQTSNNDICSRSLPVTPGAYFARPFWITRLCLRPHYIFHVCHFVDTPTNFVI